MNALDDEKKQLIISIQNCLQPRFDNLHQNPIFPAFHIFDHKNWPDMNVGDGW